MTTWVCLACPGAGWGRRRLWCCPGQIRRSVFPIWAQLQVLSYHAKPGGGYAEVHELRGYRPGDSLREVHWKLTAKVDHPIVREPQTPNRGPVILTLDLPGDPGALDSCLDQTCWLAGGSWTMGSPMWSAGWRKAVPSSTKWARWRIFPTWPGGSAVPAPRLQA